LSSGGKIKIMKLLNYGVAICVMAILLSAVSICGCAPAGNAQTELRVFSAISLKKPMTKIARAFEINSPDVKVNVNCAGSGNLVTQIIAGAPVDVFISASIWDMNTLIEKGLIDQGTRRILTGNWLVLVTAADNPLELHGFKDLASEKVKRIALGNPKLLASGIFANEVLTYYGIKGLINNKLIYCDQMAQLSDNVSRKEVDAGIIFYTDYLERKDQLSLIEDAPDSAYTPVRYPVAVVNNSLHPTEAARFIEWLFSEKSGVTLAEYGFRLSTEVVK